MRRTYVDWARGIAVLVMIEAHTFDAWTRTADRSTHAFRNLTILGGLAAPFFLFLAGLALILAAESMLARTGDRRAAAEAVARRGAEIFILAFLFRLQALIVTPGSPLITLFRVDILNIMGPSMLAASLVWGLVPNGRRALLAFTALAVAVAMVTPVVRVAHWVGELPIWLQWHMRPAGDYTNFTFFPWTGFVFAGAAAGMVLGGSRSTRSERAVHLALAIAGVLLVVLGLQAARLPTIYRASSFWTSSPTYFAIRAGVVLIALASLYVLSLAGTRVQAMMRPVERFGRGSLFVYWIHVELVYGYATWFLRHRLALWQTAFAYVLFCAVMYAALVGRDRLLERVDARASARSPSIIGG